MINSLHIKSVACFNDEGIQFEDLKKINYIYGSNASGKTTITNFIHDPDNVKFDNCEIKWEGDQPITALVYNKGFRDRNFGKEDIDGVFTLGEATKEQIEIIKNKEIELKDLRLAGKEKREKKESLEKQLGEEIDRFKERAWSIYYKKYEDIFKEAFRGFLSKQTFYEKLLFDKEKNLSELRSLEELRKKATTIFGEPPQELPILNLVEYSRLIEIEAEEIWSQKIVGKTDVDIAILIQRLNINDWVNEGRKYLQDGDICPFCQQKNISVDFRSKLERYFDETYSTALGIISTLSEEYLLLCENLLNQLDGIESREKENQRSKLNTVEFSALLKTLRSKINTNKERLSNKTKEPSRSTKLDSLNEQLTKIQSLLGDANKLITEHNQIVSNFNDEKKKLTSEVWRMVINEGKTEIDAHVKKINGLEKTIETASSNLSKAVDDYKFLKKEIVELNKNVTSVQPTVDEINRTLASYGFTSFNIVPSVLDDNKYQIKRENGELAQSTLSEGEITFITFLYFLQRAKGGLTEESVNDERVLVIDDPISSLDSNVLFVVSSLIKEIIKSIREGTGVIKQILLLTHNVYFHKEVSYISGRSQIRNNTNFWIIRKRNKISTIQSYGMENPISTSYELLWRELIEREKNSGIAIQNIMRRIIENYFKILGKYGDDELILMFEKSEDQEICRSLICWINDGSHSIAEDLYIEVPDDTIERYFEVFRQIFINTQHIGHYNMMMRVEEESKETSETTA